MKIALIILHADVARGGAERYTLDLAAALANRGHAVSILASSFQTEAIAGTPVLLRAHGITRTRRYLSFLASLEAHLAQNRYDIVHAMLPVRQCDVYHPHAGIAGASKGNLFNPRRSMFASVESELFTCAHPPIVLCLSHLIQDMMQKHYPQLPRSQMIPLFNGTDLVRFDPTNKPQSRMEVRQRFQIPTTSVVGLMLAQDFERKGLAQAIESLSRVNDPRLILLVGGKQDPAPYHRLAKSLQVQERVIFAGPVLNPAEFYQAADFFVLPTRFDPCSLVVLEALAMGLPVISTQKNGACEIMEQGIHGYILPNPNDIAALTEALQKMLNAVQVAIMSKACLQLRSSLSQEAHIDRLLEIYFTRFQDARF